MLRELEVPWSRASTKGMSYGAKKPAFAQAWKVRMRGYPQYGVSTV
jgi:hypothetical protein